MGFRCLWLSFAKQPKALIRCEASDGSPADMAATSEFRGLVIPVDLSMERRKLDTFECIDVIFPIKLGGKQCH